MAGILLGVRFRRSAHDGPDPGREPGGGGGVGVGAGDRIAYLEIISALEYVRVIPAVAQGEVAPRAVHGYDLSPVVQDGDVRVQGR